MSHFDAAIEEVLRAEGGLLIDPGEGSGGANMGVSLTVLREHRKNPKLTLEDLKNLTVDEAKEIYKEKYWDKLGLDQVQGKLSAILILDQAVNRGLGGVKDLLVKSLNYRSKTSFTKDTPMSEIIDVINTVPDRTFLRRTLGDAQWEYVEIAFNNPEKKRWLRGWLIRTHNLYKLLE